MKYECPVCFKKWECNEDSTSDSLQEVCCSECYAKRKQEIKVKCEQTGGQEKKYIQQKYDYHKKDKIIVEPKARKGQVWRQRLKGRGGK